MTLPDWMHATLFGNSLAAWLRALAGAVSVTLLFALLRGRVARRLGALAARTETIADDAVVEVIRSIRKRNVLIVALALAGLWLDLPGSVNRWLYRAIGLAAVFQGIRTGNQFVDVWITRYATKKGELDRTTLTALSYGLRAFVWVSVILFGLDLAGYSPRTLLTTLGIGGIAVALALQNVLADLFAALSIVLDKPFVVGDAIAVDDLEGTVEHIGLKTTRVKSINGEQLVFSNADLLKSRLRNFSRRQGRRLVFRLSVAPGTRAERLARVPAIVAEVLEAEPRADLQRSHVIGATPLGFDVETAIHVPNPEVRVAFDVRQAVLLEVCARLEREGIALASSVGTIAHPLIPTA
ncbi:MAG: mechanosensitive ion channel family protein [Gemmatimonadales bacterium]